MKTFAYVYEEGKDKYKYYIIISYKNNTNANIHINISFQNTKIDIQFMNNISKQQINNNIPITTDNDQNIIRGQSKNIEQIFEDDSQVSNDQKMRLMMVQMTDLHIMQLFCYSQEFKKILQDWSRFPQEMKMIELRLIYMIATVLLKNQYQLVKLKYLKYNVTLGASDAIRISEKMLSRVTTQQGKTPEFKHINQIIITIFINQHVQQQDQINLYSFCMKLWFDTLHFSLFTEFQTIEQSDDKRMKELILKSYNSLSDDSSDSNFSIIHLSQKQKQKQRQNLTEKTEKSMISFNTTQNDAYKPKIIAPIPSVPSAAEIQAKNNQQIIQKYTSLSQQQKKALQKKWLANEDSDLCKFYNQSQSDKQCKQKMENKYGKCPKWSSPEQINVRMRLLIQKVFSKFQCLPTMQYAYRQFTKYKNLVLGYESNSNLRAKRTLFKKIGLIYDAIKGQDDNKNRIIARLVLDMNYICRRYYTPGGRFTTRR